MQVDWAARICAVTLAATAALSGTAAFAQTQTTPPPEPPPPGAAPPGAAGQPTTPSEQPGAPAGTAKPAAPAEAEKKKPAETAHKLFEPKPGPTVTFYTPRGEITFYGYLDVSFDVTTKGIAQFRDENGNAPPGNVGWMPAMSTNLSYLGARGFLKLGGDWRFLYQLETQLDIAASSGFANTNSNSSAIVKGALTSRNSFVGIGSKLGSVKLGKTDAPYKLSTQRMNPFSGEIGDYSVVMGNTGGDNRVEFSTRLDHSIWYESPKLGPFSIAVLFSPGQNRSGYSDQIPAGGPECSGGNIPGSGGTGGAASGFPIACNDGGFGNAFSGAAAFETGPIYVTGAYERHRNVNRNSDIYAIYGAFPLPAAVTGYDTADVADEDAWKIGAQVKLPTGTTVSGIYEDFHRYVPSNLDFQNERQRDGYWLELSQKLGSQLSIHVGWAHANKTPGDPGQHNTALADVGNGGTAGGAHVDNSADMVTAALKHEFIKDVMVYAAWAGTYNAKYGHYDLGAGGRAVTTDCHDGGLPASGDTTSNPHCWAGGHLQGFSMGLNARF